MPDSPGTTTPDAPSARPWIDLRTSHDVEAWIDSYNRSLQQFAVKANATGYGICFGLEAGGDIFMHTDSEGNVLLDVTPEAEWVTPVITAATHVRGTGSRIWALPGDTLTQLVLGLSSLIATSTIVLSHPFKISKFDR
ncbi:MAG: hypothetical protein V4632_07400 [Pseudomonadota bacterium]